MPTKPITILPADGGALMSSFSEENVGAANYTRKVNLRRGKDREMRREGWVLFKPNAGLPQGVQAAPETGTRLNCLAELVRPNGDRAIVAATKTTIYRYDYSTGAWLVIGSGFSVNGKRWQVEDIDGYLILNNVVNLPVTFRVEDSAVVPIYELREIGVASVNRILQLNGILMCLGVYEIQAAYLAPVLGGVDPYGIVTPSILNARPYRIVWSDPLQPRNWAPGFSVTMSASSATIVLPFPSSVFVAGVTRVSVANGGPDGGDLGGDETHPDGILVTGVAGNVLTLEIPTNAALTYPRTVFIERWSDISSIAGRYDLQGDSSPILTAKRLQGLGMIYRPTGIYTARFTGDVDNPFDFKERQGTVNVPTWPDAIVSVNDEYHLYPGQGDRFYMFDGVSPPTIHQVTDAARDIIFNGTTPDSDVWAVDNVLTKEVWFCAPTKVMAYDYEFKTVSEIDAGIHAGAVVLRPQSTDRWFIMTIEDRVETYGLTGPKALVQIHTWLRNGVAAGGVLKGGLIHWGTQINEKVLLGYVVHRSSGSAASAHQFDLNLWATYDAAKAPVLLCTAPIASDDNFVPMHFADIYLQDELVIVEAGDLDILISGRSFIDDMNQTLSAPRVKLS